MNEKREVIVIRKIISPGQTVTVKERIKSDGFIVGCNARFYAGQSREMKVLPYVLHKGNRTETFFTFPEGTEPTISGEDDTFRYPLTIAVQYDDEVHVRVENQNDTYDYTLAIDIEVVYMPEGNRGR